MPSSQFDDPWTLSLDDSKPERVNTAAPAATNLPPFPQFAGDETAPIAACSLADAWIELLRARRDHVAALHHRAVVGAVLSIAFRASHQGSRQPTIAMTQEHVITQPAYMAAADLVHKTDAAYFRALAQLEIARAQAGMSNAEPSFKLPVEW